MVLDIGELGLRVPPEAAQQDALASLHENLGEEGVYLLPIAPKEQWEDTAAQAAFAERAAQMPYGFVVFQPQGINFTEQFPLLLARQGATDVLSALLAALVISFTVTGFVTRMLLVGAMGLFAWLTISVPYWNWYRFPADFTLANLIEQAVGWLLAGIIIAWLVRPKSI
jgi:hypothetical protein